MRSVERGELPPGIDVESSLDLLGGPLYWRLVVVRIPLDEGYFDRLTAQIIGGLKAAWAAQAG